MKDKKINVLHIVDKYSFGGVETIVYKLIERFENKKINCYYFFLRDLGLKERIIKSKVIIRNYSKYSISPFFELLKFIDENKISIIHTHHKKGFYLAYLISLFRPELKFIHHEHGDILQKNKFYTVIMKRYKKRLNIIISVSKATKEELIKKAHINPKKIVVLYNFVDTDKFNRKNITWDVKKEKNKLGIRKDEFVIGFVGRLAYVKGCDILIKALPHLYFKYKVLIAGEGPERRRLEKLADKLGVRDKIIFLGYVDNPLGTYSLVDILVTPSRSESFGLSVVEAQACGCPVITSNVSSMLEVAGKGAILVDPYNVNEIAKAMEKVIKDKKLRAKLIKEGYKNIKRFSWEKCAREILKAYEAVYNEK